MQLGIVLFVLTSSGPCLASLLERSVVSAGGATLGAPGVRMRSTLGQPAVGLIGDAATRYHVGFWQRRFDLSAFGGGTQMALGEATLSSDGGGNLIVSGFGAQGVDGVAFAMGSPDEFRVDLADALSAVDVIDAATVTLQAMGGQPLTPVGLVSALDVGAEFELTPDFTAIGSPSATIRVLNGAEEVALLEGFAGTVLSPVLGRGFGMGVDDGEICIMLMWSEPTPISLPGIGTVMGDAMMMLSETQGIVGPMFLGAGQLLGTQLPAVQIGGLAYEMFGHYHSALGRTRLQAGPADIVLSNLGSTGTDGVRIELSGDSNLELNWSIADGQAGSGDVLEIQTHDVASAPSGRSWAQMNPTDLEFSADFSALGAQIVRARLYLAGQPVAAREGSGSNAVSTQVQSFPESGWVNVASYGELPNVAWRWTSAREFFLSGFQSPFFADELRFEAVDAQPAAELASLSLLAGGLGALTLTQEGPAVAVDPTTPLAGRAQVILHPNAPNPFNPRTGVAFSISQPGPARLEVFDLRGRHVRTLFDGFHEAGRWDGVWDGRDDDGLAVASGVYHLRLRTSAVTRSRKILMLK